ncbi:MAG TPA: hypothetical protein VGB50_07560 [Flavobacterium sp.]|jgi:hypothetical protein
MKKNIVLFVLFVLPIVAYLFFASGVNSFTKLPVITSQIPDFGTWKSLDGKTTTLNGKITVLGFGGKDLLSQRGNLFNLNQKIYQQYHDFKDLQFVMICPEGTQKDAAYILNEFSRITDVKDWHFIFAPPQEIKSFHDNLKLTEKLDASAGTPNVYIIDKNRNLRGRKDNKEYKEGYNTFHPSELSNEMLDDFKIILYEYRAAFRKNNNAEKQL